jgi:hypothetical protein
MFNANITYKYATLAHYEWFYTNFDLCIEDL